MGFSPSLLSGTFTGSPRLRIDSHGRAMTVSKQSSEAMGGILGSTMLRKEYDLVVVGAGPTGLTAALAASAAGK